MNNEINIKDYTEEYIIKALKHYNYHLEYTKKYRNYENKTVEEKELKKQENRERALKYYYQKKNDESFMEKKCMNEKERYRRKKLEKLVLS